MGRPFILRLRSFESCVKQLLITVGISETSKFRVYNCTFWNRNGVVRIATRYSLEGLGIETRWWRGFPHLSRPAPRPTQPPVQWVWGLSWGKGGRGVVLTTQSHLVPRFKENKYSYTSTLPKRPSRPIIGRNLTLLYFVIVHSFR
jgi:hypothetical protein